MIFHWDFFNTHTHNVAEFWSEVAIPQSWNDVGGGLPVEQVEVLPPGLVQTAALVQIPNPKLAVRMTEIVKKKSVFFEAACIGHYSENKPSFFLYLLHRLEHSLGDSIFPACFTTDFRCSIWTSYSQGSGEKIQFQSTFMVFFSVS